MSVSDLVHIVLLSFSFFFFSSRRRHTRCYRDWSSDVCSSDLTNQQQILKASRVRYLLLVGGMTGKQREAALAEIAAGNRSEERRVGKECRSRWSPKP